MNSFPGCSKSPKKSIPLRRSGFSDGALNQNTAANVLQQNRSHSSQKKHTRRKRVEELVPKSSKKRYISDSDDDTDDCDDDTDTDSDSDDSASYVSLFQVFMNYLFPRAFPMPSEYRCRFKSAQSVSDMRERSTGKILSPVGRSSMFPGGMFVQTWSEDHVTKVHFPGAKEMFKAPRCKQVERLNK